jgi:hypothetical protein
MSMPVRRFEFEIWDEVRFVSHQFYFFERPAEEVGALSSAEPYNFLVKLRNITWETNYVIVSQNAPSTIPTLSLQSYIIDSAGESEVGGL